MLMSSIALMASPFYDTVPAYTAESPDDALAKNKAENAAVPAPCALPEVLRQGFPAAQADEADLTKSLSAWEIEWDFIPVPGQKVRLFRIVSAKFFWKNAEGHPRSLIVARNLQMAEAFAQYDDKATCFLDIAKLPQAINLEAREEFLGPACVAPGKILNSSNPDFKNKVYRELHYDGLRWVGVYGKTLNENDVTIRALKGEKLILWSAIRANNYVYLVEYDFTDDGRIIARLGFAAHNFFDRAKIPDNKNGFRLDNQDVHLHVGCWRLEFDLSDPSKKLGGPAHNELSLVSRVWDKRDGRFRIDVIPFPGDGKAKEAREGKAKWVASEFTTLRAQSTQVKNTRGLPIAYDLLTTCTGSVDNLLPIADTKNANMDFINYDCWVTHTPNEYKHYHQIPEIALNRPLKSQPATVWHSVPALHVPRDEDFGVGGVDRLKGVTLTVWIEFTLRPRNLFDSTPLYSPVAK